MFEQSEKPAVEKPAGELSRRNVFSAGLALGAATLMPSQGAAQNLLDRLKGDVVGELGGLAADVRSEAAYVFGMEAYVYGFPLVLMDVTRAVTTAASRAGQSSAPINQFARMRTYVDPDFKNVVRISRNSLWSFGFVDLENEAFVYSQPDTRGRYIVMQALNMWTDDFASVGSRTTGTGPGNFLLVGPKWNGKPPADVKATFRSSTRYAWVLVQIAAASSADFAEINELQDRLQLTPLSAWGRPYTPPTDVPVDPSVDLTATPYDQVRLMTAEMFFARLARLLPDNPPYAADAATLAKLKKIGVEQGKDFDPGKLHPGIMKGLDRVPGEVWMRFQAGPYSMAGVNGWVSPLNLGRYGTDYETRALIAWLGLGALTSDDAVYPSAFVDANGDVLDGRARYVMHFDKDNMLPSNTDVWSISPYRENFYVRNAIDRYAILSGMPLKYNPDGSLDIYIQAVSPGAERQTNWLPCPPSLPFNVTIRVYHPKQSLLDGTYRIPPLKRVG